MKIVNLETFLSLPEGTVFSNYNPNLIEEIKIKGRSVKDSPESYLKDSIDFFYQCIEGALDADDCEEYHRLLDESQEMGTEINFDFECEGRDGLFNKDQLFAVWSKKDVVQLINRLMLTLI